MPKQAPDNAKDDASEDVSELFRRISQPELGYHSFDLALQDEEAPTVADVKKLVRKLDEAPPVKSVATAKLSEAAPAKPAGVGKLLRAWSPESPPEPQAEAPPPPSKTEGTDLKAMFSAMGKAKPPRSTR
ncbi:hypothetical protein ABOZ73_03410 [Caulobacter sp. 73W]|uniref:Uncharacterized protein n=1 Tax=Caulobacter sp. 73W TaxID=3161137 RepID=A0AB39KU66_9CAUL